MKDLFLLESLESHQLNLGLYTTRVTAGDLCRAIEEAEGSASPVTEVEAALRDLVAQGEAIEWKPGTFRSRIAEMVRCLRLLRQRLWWQKELADAPLLIEDVRVEFRERTRPKRDAVPIAQAVPPGVAPEVAEAFEQAVGFPTLSGFQKRAIEQVFACAGRGNPDNEAFIIAGDTGAGKTEAFLFPILLDIAGESPELRQQPGVRAVLVYPRIRLARNQLGRLLCYTGRFHAASGPRTCGEHSRTITVGIQNGDVPRDQAALVEAWPTEKRDGRPWYRADLLETCVECEEGHYWLAADDPGIETGCPRLVCDRCGHVVDTLHVTQKALERNAPDFLIITDVSLSQWLAREKYTHLWGLWQGDSVTVPPRFLVLDEVHLYERLKGAHIARLVKRFQARVRLVYRSTGEPQRHSLVIGASATLHDEQRFLAKLLDVDPQDKARYDCLRVIKPTEDELEPTGGRERYVFIWPRRLSPTPRSPQYRVNDQAAAIQIVMCAMHNLKTDVEWRGLAFFDSINDLRQFRHNYDADPSLQWIVGYDPVGRQIPPANQDELWRIRTDRRKVGERVPNHCGGDCEQRAQNGTLYECPHFRSGDCWVFARSHGWNQTLRVADSVYAGAASQLDGQDLIPTSPSLEVGYDDDAIHLVYQHKAPPSATSFIQRRGRAGRDPADSPIIITLLWPYRRDDAFYFFHPEALYDPTFDDLPLNAGNFNVQRTHTLLAFFDLLACLRRQNVDGIADDPQVVDFTQAGWNYFPPGDNVIQDFRWLPDPKRPGQQRLVVKHRQTKQSLWFSGGQLNHIQQRGSALFFRGWLALGNDLTEQILLPAWKRLGHEFAAYLDLSEIASGPFQKHLTYPFLIPAPATLPTKLLNRFGHKAWHSANEQTEWWNWLKTYRHIDWMLQGSDEATTLTIHYPNPDAGKSEDEPAERTADVTFGLTELLPGNVSYRLRENQVIHWTPVPPDGVSTFLYPEEDETDDAGNVVGRRLVADFLPKKSDIHSQPDSIFGIPKYLEQRFPNLPFIELRRLRAEPFGPPNEQYSPMWFYDPQVRQAVKISPGEKPPQHLLPISRRSTARANSVIVPYIPAERGVAQRQLLAPLANLFGEIGGFLDEGRAMLGYTRVFYEMQIDLKTDHQKRDALHIRQEDLTLRRVFYDAAGNPTLVGYAIETQGIRFQVNPDLLAQTVEAILADKYVRLHLRRNFAVYQIGQRAAESPIFIKSLLEIAEVAVDYWLHQVVPQSQGEPRLLDLDADRAPLEEYCRAHRIVRQTEVDEFATHLTGDLYAWLNESLEKAFKGTSEFHDFVQSVVLHSLSALLKNLIARLGGVGSDDLVAYADLPVFDQVDRSIAPRILIMDTVQGGSGGIAQAFERLDLTDNEGSLWWMLQTELGDCPIANGEALVRATLSRATPDQIQATQTQLSPASLEALLNDLSLAAAAPEALEVLGRTLANVTEVGGQTINAALILRELFLLQQSLEGQWLGDVPRVATVRHAVSALDPARQPYVAALREALQRSGVSANELDHELALQLYVMFESGCDDGCPVCLSAESDMEHYYLSPLLNSRRALKKLREVLLSSAPRGDCLAALSDVLLAQEPVQVQTHPGSLGDRLDPTLGLGVVTEVDDTGQVQGASAVVVEPDHARDFIADGRWEERWGGPEHKPYETPGGVRVRSKSEYIIATKLEAAGIRFEYEPRLAYTTDEGKTRFIHPDFYLYEHGLYVEYWGRSDPDYVESRQFREQVYERLATQRGIRVLHLEAGDVENDVFVGKVKAVMGSNGAKGVSDDGYPGAILERLERSSADDSANGSRLSDYAYSSGPTGASHL